jgi:hypothetical protein
MCGLLVAAASWGGCDGSSGEQSSLGGSGASADGGAKHDGEQPDTAPPDAGGSDTGGPQGACVPTQIDDKPDMAFADTNCDGIDGSKGSAVFVSPFGDDGNDGTMAHPKKTIGAALAAATVGSPPKDIYLDRGTYNETVTMVPDVNIYGGYDSTAGWTRSKSNVSEIAGAPALRASGGVIDEVQLVKLKGHAGPDGSAYGAVVVSATVTFTDCSICADDGGPGARGRDGLAGNDGGPGMRGISGSNFIVDEGFGGDGGQLNGCTVGGKGGDGGRRGTAGQNGLPGEAAGSTVAGGGPGGTPSPACSVNAGNGTNGQDGADGAPGGLSPAVPSFGTPDGLRLGRGGNGTAGLPGSGGGGGGGGGAGLDPDFPAMCTAETSDVGGGGGGGGGGGCPGGIGGGGGDGGASLGVFGFNATLFFVDCTLQVGQGGAGGDGGNGGPGGAKGENSSRGSAYQFSGEGGNGGFGGKGGDSGPGGGGAGGAAACFGVTEDSTITSSGTTCQTPAASAPGGHGGIGAGLHGTDGFATEPVTTLAL